MSADKGHAKVVARIVGGLGNQLFCYAAARRLALASDAELVIDDTSGFLRDHEYQRQYQLDRFRIPCRRATPSERLEPFSRARRYLKRLANHRLPFEKRNYIRQETIPYDPRILSIKPRGTVFFEGYWQSERYFKDFEAVIRSDLEIIAPDDYANQTLADKILNSSAVAVHVRFFDSPSDRGASNAPADYYARAIDRMERIEPRAHYFVFSDDPTAARSRIPLPDSRMTLVSHNRGDAHAYADLWLMTLCRHFVIANSTFSWWGAWLSGAAGKCVIAPALELRSPKTWWGFDGLLPTDWIKL